MIILNRLFKLLDKVNLIGAVLSGSFIVIMGIIVTYEIIMRYFFRAPTSWVLEVSTYLSVASVFLAGGYAMTKNAHINVDLSQNVFQPKPILFQLVSLILSLIYCLVFA
jgi:TRAP-type C4-dicarboxylate transport system permease small subunit